MNIHMDFSWRIWYPQSAGSFITCIEHRYAVVLFGFSGHDATFSLMWSRDLCDWFLIFYFFPVWNNSPRVDISLQLDTLFWFRANAVMLRLSINWKSIKKRVFTFWFKILKVNLAQQICCNHEQRYGFHPILSHRCSVWIFDTL
jgi:hypothetical protein